MKKKNNFPVNKLSFVLILHSLATRVNNNFVIYSLPIYKLYIIILCHSDLQLYLINFKLEIFLSFIRANVKLLFIQFYFIFFLIVFFLFIVNYCINCEISYIDCLVNLFCIQVRVARDIENII